MSEPKLRKLLLYREVGSRLIPYEFMVDEHRVIRSEKVLRDIPAEASEAKNIGSHPNPEIQAHIDNQRQRGAVIEVRGATTILHKGTKLDALVAKFFDFKAACPFSGCEALREQYAAELKEKYGENCKGCQANRLKRQWWERIITHVIADESNSGT